MPQPDAIALRVANLAEKDRILAWDPKKFFTEPHYNGFPAILINLPAITCPRELEPLIMEALAVPGPEEFEYMTVAGTKRSRRAPIREPHA